VAPVQIEGGISAVGLQPARWSTHVTEEHFPLIVGIKRAGFDGGEASDFEGTPDHFHMLGRAIRDNGLKATAVTIIPGAERKRVGADPAIRSAELDQLKWAIGCRATYLR